MKAIVQTGSFQKDMRRLVKRGKDLSKLYFVVEILALGDALPVKYTAHMLKGQRQQMWDCHIEPDWLLLYEVTDDEVRLIRTGTHSDLF